MSATGTSQLDCKGGIKDHSSITGPHSVHQFNVRQSNVRQDGAIKDKFIIVADPKVGIDGVKKFVEVPLLWDGSLPLTFLDRIFPGVHNLKYTNQQTGRERIVMFDELTKAFLAPFGGWDDKIFEIVDKYNNIQHPMSYNICQPPSHLQAFPPSMPGNFK